MKALLAILLIVVIVSGLACVAVAEDAPQPKLPLVNADVPQGKVLLCLTPLQSCVGKECHKTRSYA